MANPIISTPGPILVASGALAIATAAAYVHYKQLQFEGEQLARDNGFTDEDRGFGAIRHAYAAGVLVQEGVDPDIVKMLGDANERRKDYTELPIDMQDRNRDLWNNDRGIENGIGSSSKKEVAEKTISDANASKANQWGQSRLILPKKQQSGIYSPCSTSCFLTTIILHS